MAKGLEAELLIAKGSRIMLMANLWTEARLVNRALGTIVDIVFEENGPPSLPMAVFVNFNTYEGVTITNTKGIKVVPIGPIKQIWEGKNSESVQDFKFLYAWHGLLLYTKVKVSRFQRPKLTLVVKNLPQDFYLLRCHEFLRSKTYISSLLLLTDYNV